MDKLIHYLYGQARLPLAFLMFFFLLLLLCFLLNAHVLVLLIPGPLLLLFILTDHAPISIVSALIIGIKLALAGLAFLVLLLL